MDSVEDRGGRGLGGEDRARAAAAHTDPRRDDQQQLARLHAVARSDAHFTVSSLLEEQGGVHEEPRHAVLRTQPAAQGKRSFGAAGGVTGRRLRGRWRRRRGTQVAWTDEQAGGATLAVTPDVDIVALARPATMAYAAMAAIVLSLREAGNLHRRAWRERRVDVLKRSRHPWCDGIRGALLCKEDNGVHDQAQLELQRLEGSARRRTTIRSGERSVGHRVELQRRGRQRLASRSDDVDRRDVDCGDHIQSHPLREAAAPMGSGGYSSLRQGKRESREQGRLFREKRGDERILAIATTITD